MRDDFCYCSLFCFRKSGTNHCIDRCGRLCHQAVDVTNTDYFRRDAGHSSANNILNFLALSLPVSNDESADYSTPRAVEISVGVTKILKEAERLMMSEVTFVQAKSTQSFSGRMADLLGLMLLPDLLSIVTGQPRV